MSRDTLSAGTLQRGNLTYFPVVPGRLEFAWRLRRYLLIRRPRYVAVELPWALGELYSRAVARLPQMSVILLPERDGRDPGNEEAAAYIPVEPADPFVEALRSAHEIGAPAILLEPPTATRPHLADWYPDAAAVELIGPERYLESYRLHPQARSPAMEWHAAAMAWRLQGADPLEPVLVVVSFNLLDPLLDAMETPQEEPPAGRVSLFSRPQLYNLHPECLAEVTQEAPFYQDRYEEIRRQDLSSFRFERARWQLELLKEAEREYHISTGDEIASWQRRGLAKFTRNLAMLDGGIMPGVYDLTLGARSLVDDNYAYEVWQVAGRFREQQTVDPPLETLNLSGGQVWLHTRRLLLRRRLPRMKQMLKPRGLKRRKREREAGEWARQTQGTAICSYPPEDIVIENYGRFLKQYAKSLVSEERSRTEPFTTSLHDGIDLRETIRNWHRGQLFVRQLGRFAGDVGAVVIIFDEDLQDRYQYRTTWLGEHQNESDMAFYSTPPFDHLVGPGIGRAEYGGLLMTLPPRRMYDVWSDPDYDQAETKAERLVMAAIDYSVNRLIVYAAKKPPRSHFRQLAARANRKIIYVPLGQLSPTKLKKLRVVHVLDRYERRQDAREYIW